MEVANQNLAAMSISWYIKIHTMYMHIQTSGMLHSNNGSQLPTFWDLSVPSSRVKQSKNSLTLREGTDRLPKTLLTINLCCVTSQKIEDNIYTVTEAEIMHTCTFLDFTRLLLFRVYWCDAFVYIKFNRTMESPFIMSKSLADLSHSTCICWDILLQLLWSGTQ